MKVVDVCVDSRDVVHHDIHSSKLRPDLGKDTNVSAIDHLGLKELKVSDIGMLTLKFDGFADLSEFLGDERRGFITVSVY